MTGRFNWNLPGLTSLASRLPFGESKTPSRLTFSAELAHSNPQFLARNQGTAYIETFDANGGVVDRARRPGVAEQQPPGVRPFARAIRRARSSIRRTRRRSCGRRTCRVPAAGGSP